MEKYNKQFIKDQKVFIAVYTGLSVMVLALAILSPNKCLNIINGFLLGWCIGMIYAHYLKIRDIEFRDMIDNLWKEGLKKSHENYFELAQEKQKLEKQLNKYKGGKK